MGCIPPGDEQILQFLKASNEDADKAYQQAVERLLKSSHFGERWAMDWLDLGRYADSDGYEKDLPRPHAWRWRNWLIDAINRDLPFDQFTEQQLAGDLLPDATIQQKIGEGVTLGDKLLQLEADVYALFNYQFQVMPYNYLNLISSVTTLYLAVYAFHKGVGSVHRCW